MTPIDFLADPIIEQTQPTPPPKRKPSPFPFQGDLENCSICLKGLSGRIVPLHPQSTLPHSIHLDCFNRYYRHHSTETTHPRELRCPVCLKDIDQESFTIASSLESPCHDDFLALIEEQKAKDPDLFSKTTQLERYGVIEHDSTVYFNEFVNAIKSKNADFFDYLTNDRVIIPVSRGKEEGEAFFYPLISLCIERNELIFLAELLRFIKRFTSEAEDPVIHRIGICLGKPSLPYLAAINGNIRAFSLILDSCRIENLRHDLLIECILGAAEYRKIEMLEHLTQPILPLSHHLKEKISLSYLQSTSFEPFNFSVFNRFFPLTPLSQAGGNQFLIQAMEKESKPLLHKVLIESRFHPKLIKDKKTYLDLFRFAIQLKSVESTHYLLEKTNFKYQHLHLLPILRSVMESRNLRLFAAIAQHARLTPHEIHQLKIEADSCLEKLELIEIINTIKPLSLIERTTNCFKSFI